MLQKTADYSCRLLVILAVVSRWFSHPKHSQVDLYPRETTLMSLTGWSAAKSVLKQK